MQSITKNSTEVCCAITFHRYISKWFWQVGYFTSKSLKKEELFKMFKCDICENTFIRERNMRRHKENVQEKSTGVCCNKCQKSFSRVSLKAHQKVSCKCRRCNKQFDTLNLLNNHHCFIKEAPPMKKCNSVAVNNGKFTFDKHFVCNLKDCCFS